MSTRAFEIKSSLEHAADSFIAEVTTTDLYRNASPGDRFTLSAGYRDTEGHEHIIEQIAAGVVDRYVLRRSAKELTASIEGRDQVALLGQTRVRFRFLRLPRRDVTEKLVVSGQAPVDEIPSEAGHWTAKGVAERVAEMAGVSLSWEARDYLLREDYDADGTTLDIIRDLASAWQVSGLAALRVDVFMNGTTVVVRARQLDPVPEWTYTIPHSRILDLTIERKAPVKIGTVVLEGRRLGSGDFAPGAGAGGVFSSGELTETETHETFDVAGNVLSRTVAENTYRMPDRILIRQVLNTYAAQPTSKALVHVSRKTTENRYEGSIYDESGPVNNPHHLEQTVTVEGIHRSDRTQTWRVLSTEQTSFDYDHRRFLSKQTTLKRTLNLRRNFLEEEELVDKMFREKNHLTVEVRTEVHRRDKRRDRWYLHSLDVVPAAGYRVGGPGRGRPSTFGDAASGERERIQFTLSSDPDAIDVRYVNEHMAREDLEYLEGLIRALHGRWEYELRFRAITMPWLRKGKVILFTGLEDHEGNPLPLAPALLYAVDTAFKADTPPSLTSQVQAVFWRA